MGKNVTLDVICRITFWISFVIAFCDFRACSTLLLVSKKMSTHAHTRTEHVRLRVTIYIHTPHVVVGRRRHTVETTRQGFEMEGHFA